MLPDQTNPTKSNHIIPEDKFDYTKAQPYPGFGAILKYQWARTFEDSVVLDISGNVIEEDGKQILLAQLSLALHPREFC